MTFLADYKVIDLGYGLHAEYDGQLMILIPDNNTSINCKRKIFLEQDQMQTLIAFYNEVTNNGY